MAQRGRPRKQSFEIPPEAKVEVGVRQPERGKLYWCRRPFDYGLPSRPYDRGELLKMIGLRNDEKLVRLGYLQECPPGRDTWECGHCGGRFIDMGSRDGHVKMRHLRAGQPLSVGMAGATGTPIDTEGEAEERRLEAVAPLYLERTAASQA